MAVAGERIERNVGDHADFRHRALDRPRCTVDEIIGIENAGTCIIAQVRVDIGKRGDSGDAELGRALRLTHRHIDGKALNTRHGVDVLAPVRALAQENRPDQIIDGQLVFLNQTSRPIRLAHASQAAALRDFIDCSCRACLKRWMFVHDCSAATLAFPRCLELF